MYVETIGLLYIVCIYLVWIICFFNISISDEVIRGWDEGVATMKKGEKAIFTIPPNLAYGELGSPPLIPPKSTFIFYIEMLSWTKIRDITGDGGILKKITKEGEGWATPRQADQVLGNIDGVGEFFFFLFFFLFIIKSKNKI